MVIAAGVPAGKQKAESGKRKGERDRMPRVL
jgi:hypothetical protein